jgi:hypothetical protein
MNIYAVLSECLSVTIPILDDGTGPKENYCICQMVVARTRSQARLLAWKSDRDSYCGSDLREMPRFATRLVERDVEMDVGVIADRELIERIWEKVPESFVAPSRKTRAAIG